MNVPASNDKRRYTLAELLTNQNLSAVARALGVNSKTLFRWRDSDVIPGGDKLQALAQFFAIDANQIDLSKPIERAS